MAVLLRRHGEPILRPDPAGPPWQRGSTFNPTVLRLGADSWRMLFRATPTGNFGVAGEYASCIGVADSVDGVHWTVREQPLIFPTLPEEYGLGCEDPRATVIAGAGDPDTAVVRVLYTGAELRAGWRWPKVRVLSATVRDDFTRVDKHGVCLQTGSPDRLRLKAAALFPQPRPDGRWPMVFTFGAESPYGTLLYAGHLTLDELTAGVSADEVARMFVNDRERHVLLAPPSPVERGPEVGAPPILVGTQYLMVHCPANAGPVRRWGIGVLLLDGASHRVVGELTDLLEPCADGERHGVVDNVAFASAAVYLPEADELRVYYGGGDRCVFLAYGRMSEIVEAACAAGVPEPGWPY